MAPQGSAPAPPPIQSISIPRSEQRSTAGARTPYRVYAVLVSLPVRSWTVYRRYSEFLALHRALCEAPPGGGGGGALGDGVTAPPPAPFPPKHAAKHALKQLTTLGGWLGTSSSAGTSSSSSAAGTGGQSETETETLEERERRIALETYLRAIISSTDARWRERAEFLNFLEVPRTDGQAGGRGGGENTEGRARAVVAAAERRARDAAATAASARTEPLSSPSTLSTTTRRTMPGGAPFTDPDAVGGAGSTLITACQLGPQEPSPIPASAQPGEHLAHQQALLAAQDASLADLTSVIRRQRTLGLAINQELAEQSELLGALDDELDATGAKMRGAERKMERLEGKKR